MLSSCISSPLRRGGLSWSAGRAMSYNIEIEKKPDFLHVVVTGRNSPKAVAGYLAAIRDACKASEYTRVLIEERLEGPRLGILDVYKLASEGSEFPFGLLSAVAYVDVNAEGDLMQFAETTAVNRDVPVRVFDTLPGAEEWLQQKRSPARAS